MRSWNISQNFKKKTCPEERKSYWKKVLNIRNNNRALKYGSIENVWKSGDDTYAYLRSYEDESVVVVVNFRDKRATGILSLPFSSNSVLHDELNGQTFTAVDPSNFQISVPAYGSMVLVFEKNHSERRGI